MPGEEQVDWIRAQSMHQKHQVILAVAYPISEAVHQNGVRS